MKIDWKLAPEGTTHFGPKHDYLVENWFRCDESGWLIWTSSGWSRCCGGLQTARVVTLIKRPPIQEWTGEGLPPVGAVCEINHPDLNWVQCEIVAHKHMACGGHTHAIAWIDGNTLDQSQGLRFRPIRTPEQIAAETEEREALEIQRVIAPFFDNPMGAAFALHKAGYRKQVKP